jgi:hypothetical protein
MKMHGTPRTKSDGPSPNLFELDPEKVARIEREFPASQGRCWWWRMLRWAEFADGDPKTKVGWKLRFSPPAGASPAERERMQLAFEAFKDAERGAYNYELARRFLDEELQQHDRVPWANLADWERIPLGNMLAPSEPPVLDLVSPEDAELNPHSKFMVMPECKDLRLAFNLKADDAALARAFFRMVHGERLRRGIVAPSSANRKGRALRPVAWAALEKVDARLAKLEPSSERWRQLRQEAKALLPAFRQGMIARATGTLGHRGR